MKRRLTPGRAVLYLLYLTIACTLVVSATYARYSSDTRGQAAATVAAVALDVTSSASRLDLTAHLQKMHPGETRKIEFSVTNQKDGRISQVSQDYSIAVNTTGNLPLTYQLAPLSQNPEGTFVQQNGITADHTITWPGGMLPGSGSGITHTYTLTVSWPSDQTDERYASEIDLVTLIIDSEQTASQTAP